MEKPKMLQDIQANVRSGNQLVHLDMGDVKSFTHALNKAGYDINARYLLTTISSAIRYTFVAQDHMQAVASYETKQGDKIVTFEWVDDELHTFLRQVVLAKIQFQVNITARTTYLPTDRILDQVKKIDITPNQVVDDLLQGLFAINLVGVVGSISQEELAQLWDDNRTGIERSWLGNHDPVNLGHWSTMTRAWVKHYFTVGIDAAVSMLEDMV